MRTTDPGTGGAKVDDLAGVRVYELRMANQLCVVAYRVLDEETAKLLMVAPHENFCRNLKRVES